MSDLYLIVSRQTNLVIDTATGQPDPSAIPGCDAVLRAGKAESAWRGWVRQADGTFLGPDSQADVVVVVSKIDLFRRCSEAEADAVMGALAQTSSRMQAIFSAAVTFRSDAEEWPVLHDAAVSLFGDARAAVLLAPSA